MIPTKAAENALGVKEPKLSVKRGLGSQRRHMRRTVLVRLLRFLFVLTYIRHNGYCAYFDTTGSRLS